MNTPEKYICAYIVESLTGIQGSSHDRVVEVLKGGDFKIEDPFLNLIYNIARTNPESSKIKDIVAGLVVGHTLLVNKSIQDAVESTVESQIEQRLAEGKKKEEKKRDVTLCYSIEKDTMCCTVWFDTTLMATVMVPATIKEVVIEKFFEKFPEGHVVS